MVLLSASAHPAWVYNTPGTFSALMDLYEHNYIHMRRLVPELPPAAAARVSQVPGGLDLHLRILERSRYTSELVLTYQFVQDQGPALLEPDLRIRVYHDARLAEVMGAHLRHHATLPSRGSALAKKRGAHLDLYHRWRINRFLYKWLNYCLRQGHCFSP